MQIVWAETVRQTAWRASQYERDPGELLIIILTPTMSRRMTAAGDALGLAAVTLHDGGRVAYVLFDRVGRVALTSATDPREVLGLVIAHELGHLMLPYGSHSPIGLMRPTWHPDDFKGAHRQQFNFTSAQTQNIRERLRRRTGPSLMASAAQ